MAMDPTSLLDKTVPKDVVLPPGLITPEFDIEALTVEELKQELKLRSLHEFGSKDVLLKRLRDAIANGQTSAKRLTKPVSRKKRPHKRKEPTRDEFLTEEEFIDSWQKWRQARDNNNMSVKRSRENQRKKRMQDEDLCRQREEDNDRMESELRQLRDEMSFLVRAVKRPQELSDDDRKSLRDMLLAHKDKRAKTSSSASQASTSFADNQPTQSSMQNALQDASATQSQSAASTTSSS